MTMLEASASRLLAGPPLAAGPESRHDHFSRLGPIPTGASARNVIPTLEASGLLGRGGAGFPVGRKWRTVAERSAGDAVVLVNGAEGEPRSAKDRALMTLRPHLVLDGAQLAADAVGASEVILYVGSAHVAARSSIESALAARGRSTVPMWVVEAPDSYIAGEESAAVHFVNDADARPTTTPPRPFESGVGGRPTLVQNVESIAYAALIARAGDDWYRGPGRAATRGTGLVTVSGVSQPGVREIELGTSVGEVARLAGTDRGAAPAVLLGGYFGSWATTDEAWDLALDPTGLRAAGRAFGCGIISFLAAGTCGVSATARIMDYMAGSSAAQCGPCVFGLRAIADAADRLARDKGTSDDLARIERWSGQLAGRGACRHPDGAVGLLASALRVFGAEFVRHAARRGCSEAGHRGAAA
jgi:NADH:ubiquinone oxidoreductase subunit F (NADH-binding)